jgi:hypothetical protein
MLDAMAQLIGDVSMSLDGFMTGPDPRPAEPLGDGGRAAARLDGVPLRGARSVSSSALSTRTASAPT